MRSIESASRTALARSLQGLLLGALAAGCHARLAISEETLGDGGTGGTGDTGGTGLGAPPVNADAGTEPARCDNGIRSGSETDIDCGGDCPACTTGASCERHTDCQSGTCLAGVCAGASCEDGIQNGTETAVDCGGACPRCRTSSCNCASSPELTPLLCDETEGYLLGGSTSALLSADGETFVFGMSYGERADASSSSGYELFRRRPDGSTEALGDAGALGLSRDGQQLLIYEGSALSRVNAAGARTAIPIPQIVASDARLSGDGATVFGGVATASGARALARWTESGGLEPLGAFPLLEAAAHWELAVVNHDGTVVAGYVDDTGHLTPFRWTAAGGVESLGPVPDGSLGTQPTAISADGSTIAGYLLTSSANREIFRWTEADQLQIMGSAPPFGYLADASLFLSADGSTLAGTEMSGAARVVVWGPGGVTAADAEVGTLTAMTPDGSTLVGNTLGPAGFLWQPGAGGSSFDVTPVTTLLSQSGADSTGWNLQSITNISDDGRIIYGAGTCGGVPTYYRLQLRL